MFFQIVETNLFCCWPYIPFFCPTFHYNWYIYTFCYILWKRHNVCLLWRHSDMLIFVLKIARSDWSQIWKRWKRWICLVYEYLIKQWCSFCKYTNISVMKKRIKENSMSTVNRKYTSCLWVTPNFVSHCFGLVPSWKQSDLP